MRCASETNRNRAPSPSKDRDRPGSTSFAAEKLGGDYTVQLVGQLDRLRTVRTGVDDRGGLVRVNAAAGATELKVFKAHRRTVPPSIYLGDGGTTNTRLPSSNPLDRSLYPTAQRVPRIASTPTLCKAPTVQLEAAQYGAGAASALRECRRMSMTAGGSAPGQVTRDRWP